MSDDPRYEDLWSRVHALLDAGRDPLADDALCDALSEDAELLATVVRLRDDLGTLARVPVTRSRRAAARLLPWLVASTAAASVAVFFWLGRPPTRENVDPQPAATGRILSYRATSLRNEGRERIESTIELRPDGAVAHRRTARIEWRSDARPATDRHAVLCYEACLTEE